MHKLSVIIINIIMYETVINVKLLFLLLLMLAENVVLWQEKKNKSTNYILLYKYIQLKKTKILLTEFYADNYVI